VSEVFTAEDSNATTLFTICRYRVLPLALCRSQARQCGGGGLGLASGLGRHNFFAQLHQLVQRACERQLAGRQLCQRCERSKQ
jgi:hypothetical protein